MHLENEKHVQVRETIGHWSTRQFQKVHREHTSEWSPILFYDASFVPTLCTAIFIISLTTALMECSLRITTSQSEYEKFLLWCATCCSEAHVWMTLSDTVYDQEATARQKWTEWMKRSLVWTTGSALLGYWLIQTPLVQPNRTSSAFFVCTLISGPRLIYITLHDRHLTTDRWRKLRIHTTYSALLYASMIVNMGILYCQLAASPDMQTVTWINTILSSVVQPVSRSMSTYVLELASLMDFQQSTADHMLSRILPARVRALHLAYSITGGVLLYIPLPSVAWFVVSLGTSAVMSSLSRMALQWIHQRIMWAWKRCRSSSSQEDADNAQSNHDESYRKSIHSIVTVSLAWVSILTNAISPFVAAMLLEDRHQLLLFGTVCTICITTMRSVTPLITGQSPAPVGWEQYTKVGKQQLGVLITQGTSVTLFIILVHYHIFQLRGDGAALDGSPDRKYENTFSMQWQRP
jgi:hypothetical protein